MQRPLLTVGKLLKKYTVIVGGRGCLLEVDSAVRKLGFYTTRYVWAADSAHAGQKALRLVQSELQKEELLLNAASVPPSLVIDEIFELDFFATLRTLFRGSGRGATWYPEEGEEPTSQTE